MQGRSHHDSVKGAFPVPAFLTMRSPEFERKLSAIRHQC